MSRFLMVPARLDALHVKEKHMSVVRQMAEFSVLPFFEPTLEEDFNCEIPYISEAVVSQPFRNKNLQLKRGIHLHWALPDALTRGDRDMQFQEVPNRWLVTRNMKRRDKWRVDRQWVVESDYLYPPHVNATGRAVSIPYISEQWKKKTAAAEEEPYEFRPLTGREDEAEIATRASQPYRFMGRCVSLHTWQEGGENCEYYPNLTAVGYGEPTFAAFYPNCFSVFGFHDPNPGPDLTQVTYDLVGWYSDGSKDALFRFAGKNSHLSPGEKMAAFKKKFNWHIQPESGGESGGGATVIPDRMLCYARLEFKPGGDAPNPRKDTEVTVTVANTPTEALSALLAQKLGNGSRHLLESIENQLEAVQLAFRLDEKQLDTMTRFRELRHENGFTPIDSGRLWVIGKKSTMEQPGTPESGQRVTLEDLDPGIAEDLNRLNALQSKYDAARLEIEQMGKQLFADWYKYMICVYPPENRIHNYPDPNLVKYYIEKKVLSPLERKLDEAGKVESLQLDENGIITGIEVSESSGENALARRLANAVEALNLKIETAEIQLKGQKGQTGAAADYYLEQIPGPRFWQPNPPVLLMEGDAVAAGKRHGCDGALPCHIFRPPEHGKIYRGSRGFGEVLAETRRLLTPGSFGLNAREHQPWNPFLLEWETRLFPIEMGSNLDLENKNGAYSPTFITQNYRAPVLNPDLELKPAREKPVDSGNSYLGSSILSPQANPLLKQLIETQLIRRRKLFTRPQDIGPGGYDGKKSFSNPDYTLIRAYGLLNDLNVLAQTLDGFNQALLMRKQTLELPIDDPLGFRKFRDFSRFQVSEAMEDRIKNAPAPLNSFNPIRSGYLKLQNLNLVDTFGQVRRLNPDLVHTTYKMSSAGRFLVKLPPRLVQPARLNFRWLNARKELDETNSHRGTTPICGWLLTNKADKSLMFYDASGKALGYFKGEQWREAIDSDEAKPIAAIVNPHLKRVALYMQESIDNDPSGRFIDHMIGTIDDALENIQPEKNTGIQGAALLMGRPLAVVRTSMNLELSGPPSVNQDWNAFRRDIAGFRRRSDDFDRVQFPVRLGEYGQLNDGLVGYWLEKRDREGQIVFADEKADENGNIVSSGTVKFYSPQSRYIDSEAIESGFEYLDDGPINFYQSLADPPQTVTMLMDVQGTVHATVGILPNKEISIPQEQYARALQDIEVTFLHAPLLTRRGKIDLPLRSVGGYKWSWVEQQRAEDADGEESVTWKELFPENRITRRLFIDEWNKTTGGDGSQLWDYLMNTAGWLTDVRDTGEQTLTPAPGTAAVVHKDQRPLPVLGGKFKDKEDLVETILDLHSTGIDPVVTDAVFTGPQEIKEGWLKLRHPSS